MNNEVMISFILKSRERGRTDEQITRQLISVGWKKDSIIASFGKIAQMKAEGETQQVAPAEPAAAQPVKQPAYAPPMQVQQPPIAQQPSQFPLEAVPEKKPLFSLPKLFAKKDVQLGEAPVEKKPLFTIPKLFGKKEQPQQAAQAQMPIQPSANQQQQPFQQPAQPTPHSVQQAPYQPQAIQAMARSQPTPASSTLPPMQFPLRQQQAVQQAAAHPKPSQVLPAQPPTQFPLRQQPTQPIPPSVQQVPYQPPQEAIPTQIVAQVQPAAQQGQVSPFSGIFRYLRIFTSNKILLLAAALVVVAVLIGAVYFIVFAKGAGVAAPASPESYYPQDSPQLPPPEIPPTPPPENQGNATGAEIGNNTTGQDISPPSPPAVDAIARPQAQLPGQNIPTLQSQAQPQEIPIAIVPGTAPAQPLALVRFAKFASTGAYSLEKFCFSQNNGILFRVHYKEYYGGGCTSEKPGAEGFANTTFVLSKCFLLPCCTDGPSSAYSRSYDWFECGYAS